MARLIVFGPSHFGERARWGLDHAGIAYREERWVPGPHAVQARRLGLTATTTPILVPDDGPAVQGSDRILDHAGVPGGDPELEERFQGRIGPLVRQMVYASALSDPGSGVKDALFEGAPRGQALAGRLMWPVTRRLIVAGMRARPEFLPELTRRLDGELAWFAGVLAERGERLVGGAFGRADLTAASLLAPLAIPPECPVAGLYERVRLSEPLGAQVRRWRDEPALAWVARTYARHRGPGPSRRAA
jgi:glutathione S-transferase